VREGEGKGGAREGKKWCMGVRDDGGWKEWRVLIGDSGEVAKR
jgi:hypothetical protein